MIPLGDEGTPPQRGLPVVNLTIIIINILFFLVQLALGDSFTSSSARRLLGDVPGAVAWADTTHYGSVRIWTFRKATSPVWHCTPR